MRYRAEARDITMALVGDLMVSRPLTPFTEPGYLKLVDLLRGADLTFGNLETTVRRPDEGAAIRMRGTPMTTDPRLLEDLKWMGFDTVSCANNHAMDFGTEGCRATVAHLENAGIPYAGIGLNLAHARRPAYVETAAGRVAMIAVNSFFTPPAPAGEQRPDLSGRPGLNPLGVVTDYGVDEATFRALQTAHEQLGLRQSQRRKSFFSSPSETPVDKDDRLSFMGSTFRKSDGFSVSTRTSKADEADVLRSLSEARRQAEWVILSFHYHDLGGSTRLTATSDTEMDEPAEFVYDFARKAVDAGADVVVGHGPHLTMGIEIYKGKPILYSLGNFVFQNETLESFPHDTYSRYNLGYQATPADFIDARIGDGSRGFPSACEFWESVAVRCAFTPQGLGSLTLHPVELGFGASRASRGRPVLAGAEAAERIIARLEWLSRRYGTRLERIAGGARVVLS